MTTGPTGTRPGRALLPGQPPRDAASQGGTGRSDPPALSPPAPSLSATTHRSGTDPHPTPPRDVPNRPAAARHVPARHPSTGQCSPLHRATTALACPRQREPRPCCTTFLDCPRHGEPRLRCPTPRPRPQPHGASLDRPTLPAWAQRCCAAPASTARHTGAVHPPPTRPPSAGHSSSPLTNPHRADGPTRGLALPALTRRLSPPSRPDARRPCTSRRPRPSLPNTVRRDVTILNGPPPGDPAPPATTRQALAHHDGTLRHTSPLLNLPTRPDHP